MNFYFNAATLLDKLDKKQDSIKGLLSSLPEKDRRRMSALVIESLKCTSTFVVSQFVTLSDVGLPEPQTSPS
jgi:25S rRNA (cytosine2278-C5)-methyltransferase